jgi:hypothetical protein
LLDEHEDVVDVDLELFDQLNLKDDIFCNRLFLGALFAAASA